MMVRDRSFLVDVILLDLRDVELLVASVASSAAVALSTSSSCVSVAEPLLDTESVASE